MKDVGLVALVVAVGLAVVAGAAFGLHDPSVLVAPPEAVSESFVRELAMQRYELAHHYLEKRLQRRTSAASLRASFEPLQGRTGRPDQVVTETVMADGDRARVLARVEGRRSTASMYVDLVREHGLWRIAVWPLDVIAR
jgi:hypothetical protein